MNELVQQPPNELNFHPCSIGDDMRSGQIQHAIAHGVTPFELCHLVSKRIRSSRKKGGHIQDSIGAVFHSLNQHTGDAGLTAKLDGSSIHGQA